MPTPQPAHHDIHEAPNNKTNSGQPSSLLDLLAEDDPLRAELEQVLGEGRKLVSELKGDLPADETGDISQLRAEVERLRARNTELEQLLDASRDEMERLLAEQQAEYESMLEEKSELIRQLHQQVQELQSGVGGSGEAQLPGREELLRLKAELEEQRRQLEEDEEAFYAQAREMELALSKDRAELARQRNEVQQMYRQLQHEIEAATRDGDLRERLLALQRRHMENATAGPARSDRPTQPAPRQAKPTQQSFENGEKRRSGSGLIRRLFGG